MTEKTNLLYKNLYNANELIFAKYFANSILENRIIALVLFSIQNNDYIESEKGDLIVSFGIKNLVDFCGVKGHSYAQLIDDVKDSIQSRWIGYTDYEKKSFCYKPLFVGAALEKGVLTLSVNGDFRNYLINIASRGNYTSLSLLTLMSLKSNYSVRLYEILRKSCFSREKTNSYTCQINVTELKLMLGVYKIDKKTQKELEKGYNANYSLIESLHEDDYYSSFRRFNEKILSKAVNEINEKSDIKASFEQVKREKGGRTVALIFTCSFKDRAKDNLNIEDKLHDTVLNSAKDIFNDMGFSDKELNNFCKLADYKVSKLKEAKNLYDLSKDSIENPVAWITAAIKNNYSLPTKTVSKKKNVFDIEGRKYDFKKLESELLGHDPE